MARKPITLAAITIMVLINVGCEITASVYVQKDWNTDPHLYKSNDLVTKGEFKVSKLIGADAKREKLKAIAKP